MRQIINRLVLVLFAVTVLLFGAFTVHRLMEEKNTPPQLVCDAEEILLSIHNGQDKLLDGVTAADAEDGDLTDCVLVENISRFVEPGVFRVTYAVQDSNNAVAKLTRTARYTDYTSPRFSLKGPLVFDHGKNFNPADQITVTDCIDGDLSDDVRMTLLENAATISGVGDWQVQFWVTNSMGDTVYLTTEVKVREQTAQEKQRTPVIQLKEYLVYVPLNATFSLTGLVDSVTVQEEASAGDPDALRERIRIASGVDTTTPGIYTVTYTCTADNGYSGSADLLVVVTDEQGTAAAQE